MKNHLYQSKNGMIHLCEGGHVTIDKQNYLVWTKCGVDVPANKSFKSYEYVTCPKCIEEMFWGCKYCGDNEEPGCHKCVRDDGKLVSDELAG